MELGSSKDDLMCNSVFRTGITLQIENCYTPKRRFFLPSTNIHPDLPAHRTGVITERGEADVLGVVLGSHSSKTYM